MVAPSVEYDPNPKNLQINWLALSAAAQGGLPLLQYKVQFQTASGLFMETQSCDGSHALTIDNLRCTVPLLELLDEPFNLQQGKLIQARVIHVNAIGESIPSILNSFGALVEFVPHKPPVAPTKNYQTT